MGHESDNAGTGSCDLVRMIQSRVSALEALRPVANNLDATPVKHWSSTALSSIVSDSMTVRLVLLQ